MPVYMKYEGVQGSGKDQHNGWIVLESAQIGASRQTNNSGAMGANREASAPTVSDIVITKPQDIASTQLFQQSLVGAGKKVTIDFTRIDKGKEVTYMTLELENVVISSYSVSGRGGQTDKPTEALSLNFTKVTLSTKAASDPLSKPAGAKVQ